MFYIAIFWGGDLSGVHSLWFRPGMSLVIQSTVSLCELWILLRIVLVLQVYPAFILRYRRCTEVSPFVGRSRLERWWFHQTGGCFLSLHPRDGGIWRHGRSSWALSSCRNLDGNSSIGHSDITSIPKQAILAEEHPDSTVRPALHFNDDTFGFAISEKRELLP